MSNEVLAEALRLDFGLEVAVHGREEAHVDGDRTVAAALRDPRNHDLVDMKLQRLVEPRGASVGFQPVDGLLPCREEAELRPRVGFSNELAKAGRVDREIGYNGGHANAVVRDLLDQLACDAGAQVEESRGESLAIEKKARAPCSIQLVSAPTGLIG